MRLDTNNELSLETAYLFRTGMSLRRKHMALLFDSYTTSKSHPDLIKFVRGGYFIGTEKVKDEYKGEDSFYQPLPFVMSCKTLLSEIEFNKKRQLFSRQFIDGLEDVELRIAFNSGYLKHDSRGYYLTTNIDAMRRLKECSML